MNSTKTNKHIYIADIRSNVNEGKSTGHFIPVAQMYRDLFKDACQVTVAGGPIYKQYFDEESLYVLPYNISNTTLIDKWHCMLNAISLFRKAKGQIIILQHSSIVTCFIAIILFYWKTSKLFLIQYSSEGINTPLKRLLYFLCKWKIDGLICPNKEVAEDFGLPACVVPDYIYTESNKLPHSEYNNKKYDFCIVGRLAPEKGAVEAAQKFVRTDFKLLIAGKPQTKDLGDGLECICKDADNIELHLGFIERNDYERFMRESKYALLNYQGEYSIRSSGVVFDTLFSGVPVIGQRCKALQFIEDYHCGLLYDCLESFKPEMILQPVQYKKFLNAIDIYKQSHKEHKNRLSQFLMK